MDLYGPAPIQDEVETLPSQELKYYAILIYVHIDILPVHTLYLYLSTSIYICICACIDIDIDMYLCTYVYLSLYLYSNLCLLYLYIYIYMYRAGQIRQIISYAPGGESAHCAQKVHSDTDRRMPSLWHTARCRTRSMSASSATSSSQTVHSGKWTTADGSAGQDLLTQRSSASHISGGCSGSRVLVLE